MVDFISELWTDFEAFTQTIEPIGVLLSVVGPVFVILTSFSTWAYLRLRKDGATIREFEKRIDHWKGEHERSFRKLRQTEAAWNETRAEVDRLKRLIPSYIAPEVRAVLKNGDEEQAIRNVQSFFDTQSNDLATLARHAAEWMYLPSITDKRPGFLQEARRFAIIAEYLTPNDNHTKHLSMEIRRAAANEPARTKKRRDFLRAWEEILDEVDTGGVANVNALIAMAAESQRTGDYIKAIILSKRARRLMLRYSDPYELPTLGLLYNEIEALTRIGELNEAEMLCIYFQDICNVDNKEKHRLYLFVKLLYADIIGKMGRTEVAEAAFRSAIAEADRLAGQNDEPRLFGRQKYAAYILGTLEPNNFNLNKANELFTDVREFLDNGNSLKLSEETRSHLLAEAAKFEASYLVNQNRLSEAADRQKYALDEKKKNQGTHSLAFVEAASYYAKIQGYIGNSETAYQFANLVLTSEIDDHTVYNRGLYAKAMALFNKGMIDDAYQTITELLERWNAENVREIVLSLVLVEAHFLLARIEDRKGRERKAYRRVNTILERIENGQEGNVYPPEKIVNIDNPYIKKLRLDMQGFRDERSLAIRI